MDNLPKHLELVFTDAVDNIRFLKRQQWVITNYAVAILAAIYVVAESTGCVVRTLLTVLAVATAIYATYLLFDFQGALKKYRDRITAVYSEPCFNELKTRKLLPLQEKPFWHQPAYPLGLWAIVMVMTTVAVARLYGCFPGI